MFSPLAFPDGLILYDLSASLPPPSHLALAPFEIYREPLVIVAIADGSDLASHTTSTLETAKEKDGTKQGLEAEPNDFIGNLLQGLETLRVDFPRALVHRLLIFDLDMPNVALPIGFTAVPSPAKSKTTTIKTIMCDLTSDLLAEMTSYAKSLQALPTVESPKQVKGVRALDGNQVLQMFGSSGVSRPSSADRKNSSLPASEQVNLSHVASIPRHMLLEPSNRYSSSDSRSASPGEGVRTPPTTFDEITVGRTNLSSGTQTFENHDRISTYGFGAGSVGERERNKGKGRVSTVIGALYLLAGRWPDAIRELTESVATAKANSDYLWHAKALDYLLVCLLLYAWAGMDFQVSYQWKLCPSTQLNNQGMKA